ncbi:carbamoyl-phosphate synthase large subunit [Daejeonella rubra]|uniref:Carbamoyl-phosphate synthase large subunit n=2 Tax=Daejeonella rubra TaxID=990371 RepID=A0A1G9WXC2_9SPHI|nr:carbamoyl-phosphate synthase large subunit [Daejeonella rubra]
MNILVTAVGSELSFSVIKALKLVKFPFKLYGSDIHKEVVGKYWCDKFYQVPLAANEAAYINRLKEIVQSEGITAIIPTNDIEILTLSRYTEDFLNTCNCLIIANAAKEVERFNDKWLSYKWFHEHGIPCPLTYQLTDLMDPEGHLPDLSFPMILKPRIGGGSRSIFRINSAEDLLKYSQIMPDHLLQEYLYPDNEEYTAGVYRTKIDEVFVIILKRTLKFGMTNTAETVFDSDLENFVKLSILKTNLSGSVNVQFRLTDQGPMVLEINPRFSGTTGIRANFGFNDVEMSINELILNHKLAQPDIKKGFVLRYFEEQYHFDT